MKKIKKDTCVKGDLQQSLKGPADAVLALAILAISADGKLGREETALLERLIYTNRLYKDVRKAKDYMGCVASVIVGTNRAQIMAEAAALLSPSLREMAYAWAAYLVTTDGKTVTEEHRLLSKLREALGLHGVLAGKINASMAMLSRYK